MTYASYGEFIRSTVLIEITKVIVNNEQKKDKMRWI